MNRSHLFKFTDAKPELYGDKHNFEGGFFLGKICYNVIL